MKVYNVKKQIDFALIICCCGKNFSYIKLNLDTKLANQRELKLYKRQNFANELIIIKKASEGVVVCLLFVIYCYVFCDRFEIRLILFWSLCKLYLVQFVGTGSMYLWQCVVWCSHEAINLVDQYQTSAILPVRSLDWSAYLSCVESNFLKNSQKLLLGVATGYSEI